MKNSMLIQKIADASVDILTWTNIEPRSAIKQVASDLGVPYGDEMEVVVLAVEKLIGISL